MQILHTKFRVSEISSYRALRNENSGREIQFQLIKFLYEFNLNEEFNTGLLAMCVRLMCLLLCSRVETSLPGGDTDSVDEPRGKHGDEQTQHNCKVTRDSGCKTLRKIAHLKESN